MPVSVRVALESPVSSEMNEEEESPDADLDFMDEYDSEEERKQRKRKKVDSPRLLCVWVNLIGYSVMILPRQPHGAGLLLPHRK